MKNRFDVFVVNENTIRNFLKGYGKGYKSKDHEFAVAIYIKRLFERVWKKECCLAFQLKHSLNGVLENTTIGDIDKIQSIFRNQTKENTPVDFLLLVGNPNKHSSEGYAFQLKRFGMNVKKDFKSNLLKYLKETIPTKFGYCGEVALILIIDLDEDLEKVEQEELKKALNFNYFREKLNFKDYPFKKIFFFGMSDKSLHLTEVWPGNQQLIASKEEVGLV